MNELPTPEDQQEIADSLQKRWVRTPPIDIFETEDGLVLRADLPGVSSENLELQVQDNRLTLFGRVIEELPENAVLMHQEYNHGDFLRSFILSDDVDHDRISAKLTNGVLEVTLPKVPRAEPRKISIQTD
ncbi:Hsp20/alpha crystallin family protein [Thalassoglobus polymorphus]|uniref:Spore protein SP21 n=1 Tax=Thalassoglobus polymorphus TaxID=2527994 RepID=A0A517QVP2_9PLAN|nr:Hsp20/alpha crystallin family protein [Thalassoglobus polymorphus]QDT35644.1 Spore protein SP21 [Thalassoglobus polymorphus]